MFLRMAREAHPNEAAERPLNLGNSNSPPDTGGVPEQSEGGVVAHKSCWFEIDHPVCGFAAATPPVSGGELLVS